MCSRPLGLSALVLMVLFAGTGCALRNMPDEQIPGTVARNLLIPGGGGLDALLICNHTRCRDGVTREDLQPAYRPMTHCELARGRWREAHPKETDPPPALRCLETGEYPAAYFTQQTAPAVSAPVHAFAQPAAAVQTATQSEAPAQATGAAAPWLPTPVHPLGCGDPATGRPACDSVLEPRR